VIFLQWYGIGALGLAVGGMVALRVLYSLDWLAAWLIAVNGVGLVFFGLDKLIALVGGRWVRVPEAVLLGIVLGGGGGGGAVGMILFRHKTDKLVFQSLFWLIIAGEIAAVLWYFVFR